MNVIHFTCRCRSVPHKKTAEPERRPAVERNGEIVMEKVKVGFIGCGGRANAHFQKLVTFKDDVELVGFADVILICTLEVT